LALETARDNAHSHSMKIVLLVVTLSGILAAALVFSLAGWDSSAMSIHGWVALGLGTFLSLALGGGLMALTFYSARKGYDDRIEVDVPPDQD
jgi:F0F1-type ATP synthase assembly protein I